MVRGVVRHAVHQPLDKSEHRLFELALVYVAARFKPVAPIVALELAQEVDCMGSEPRVCRSVPGCRRRFGFPGQFHDDCSIFYRIGAACANEEHQRQSHLSMDSII